MRRARPSPPCDWPARVPRRHSRPVRAIIILFAALLDFAVAAPGAAVAEPSVRPIVVELFTSQGCNSCASAETLLESLSHRSDVLVLGFHVDYWDFLGWRDPYASPEHAMRQAAYARRSGVSYVYTPHLVIGGTQQGSTLEPKAVERMLATAAAEAAAGPAVRVFLADRGHLAVSVGAADWRGEADILLVRLDRERTNDVRGGANAGRTIVSRNIVRRVAPLATWSGAAVELRLPMLPLHDIAHELCAIIVQERPQGRILGAAILDLPAALAALR